MKLKNNPMDFRFDDKSNFFCFVNSIRKNIESHIHLDLP